MRRALAILAVLFLGAAHGITAERPEAGAAFAPLRMEEMVVRGLKEKPDVLYVPGLKGVAPPPTVRYDLFLVDMNRALSPSEIAPRTPPAGDNTISRSVP